MGFFQSIVDKVNDYREDKSNRSEFKAALLAAAADGKISPDEIEQLEKMKEEFGLDDDDVKAVRSRIYQTAFEAAKEDGKITTEEALELARVQNYLGVPDAEIRETKKELMRMLLLSEVSKGNLPTVNTSNVLLKRDEIAHWSEPASMLEEQVISRKYGGGSRGMSFKLSKNVRYNFGGHRGKIISEKGLVAVSTGTVVITNQRVIFSGSGKSFSTKLDKLIDIRLFKDAVQFGETGRVNPRIIKIVAPRNVDLVGSILWQALARYT